MNWGPNVDKKKKTYMLLLVDHEDTRWTFEGYIDDIPMFIKESEAVPKMMDYNEAQFEAKKHVGKDDRVLITE